MFNSWWPIPSDAYDSIQSFGADLKWVSFIEESVVVLLGGIIYNFRWLKKLIIMECWNKRWFWSVTASEMICFMQMSLLEAGPWEC